MSKKDYEINVSFSFDDEKIEEMDSREENICDLVGRGFDDAEIMGRQKSLYFHFDTQDEQVEALKELRELTESEDMYKIYVNAHINEVDENGETTSCFHLTSFENNDIDHTLELVDLIRETAFNITNGNVREAVLVLAFAAGNMTSMSGVDEEYAKNMLQLGLDEFKEEEGVEPSDNSQVN